MMYDWTVVIGRFQPLHLAHVELIQRALSLGKNVIILVGRERCARNVKNPWTFLERQEMIYEAISTADVGRVHVRPVDDYLYNDETWKVQVQEAVGTFAKRGETVCLVGNVKDDSSYYLEFFPMWESNMTRGLASMNATDIRNAYFDVENGRTWSEKVPASVANYLEKWAKGGEFKRLAREWSLLRKYREEWGEGPHVTTDAVLFWGGHVLVVERAGEIGNGCLALPGGFVEKNETIYEACRRETNEETGYILPFKPFDQKVFDHPRRSLRGRIITHAFAFRALQKPLQPTPGGDDARNPQWLSLANLFKREEEFFEDHVHIINYFASRI